MRNEISRTRTKEMLVSAMGEQITAALSDPSVVEIMMNPDGRLWIERHGQGRIDTGSELSSHEVERVIRLVASHVGQDANGAAPIVSAELPIGGERFEGVLPPITPGPCFSIRKPAGRVIGLEEYVRQGVLSPQYAQALREAVLSKLNILIVGGTGSGKTTLANALLAEIEQTGDRVLLLEDTRELQCSAKDFVAMRTQQGSVSLSDLVRSTLRLRPDRIIIGEVRGGEALDMLKAWNTGHPGGIATLHANSAEAGLNRIEQLVGEVTANIPHLLIAEAIDCVVSIKRENGSRRVDTVAHVTGTTPDGYELEPIRPAIRQIIPDPHAPISSNTPHEKGKTK
jgi:type IV secretion system protein VirB11